MTLWWISRGTGLAALVALTAGLVLGVATVPRVTRPRFVPAGLHRTLTVGALALVVAHVVTVIVDGYAPVGWLDAVVPFSSPYRTVWTGLGTVAFDVMLVAAATSWKRLRPGYRAWKLLHVASWACWPVAVAHGVATGTDTKAIWDLGLTAACVALVAGALGWRVLGRALAGPPAAVAGVAVLLALSFAGPLQRGWAAEAGTPGRLVATSGAGTRSESAAPGSDTFSGRLDAELAGSGLAVGGSLDEEQEPGAADQRAREVLTSPVPGGTLQVVLEGPAFETGLDLQASVVTLGPAARPDLYRGAVTAVRGSDYTLELASDGLPTLHLALTVTPQGATAWRGLLRADAGASGS